MTVADMLASGRSCPVHSWARYIECRQPLVDIIGCGRPLTFIVRVDAGLCAGRGWTQLSNGVLNHTQRGHTRRLVGQWDCCVQQQLGWKFSQPTPVTPRKRRPLWLNEFILVKD